METYKLTIGRQELLGALSDYLTLQNNKPIKVKESHSIDYVGFYEERDVTVTIQYEESIELLGHTATKTVQMSKDDIKDIFNKLLEDKGYGVQKLNYKTGFRTVGYYMDEREEAHFEGVELELVQIQKQLKKTVN